MDEINNLEHLSGFRALVSNELANFVQASEALGMLMSNMAIKVKNAFDLQYLFITAAVKMNRPPEATINTMLGSLGGMINEIQEFRNSNRHVQDFFNHLSAVSESVLALFWVARPSPARYVHEMKDAGDYFGNRVLSAHRNDPLHTTFIRTWGAVLSGLENYVLEYHRTGLDWGAAIRAGYVCAPADINVPPPPPPPLPQQQQGAVGQPDRSALFQQINEGGENITGMLRRVRPRGPHTLPKDGGPAIPEREAIGEPCRHTNRIPNPPKFQLEGRKWFVERQRENYGLVIETEDKSQSVYMLECREVGLDIRNKMNGIVIENTIRSTVAVKDIIAAVEMIRCSHFTLQCTGNVSTINLDRCDSVQIFLSGSSLGVDIISSNCTSINVCIVAPDGTYVELPVPEQIKTNISNGKLVSTLLEKN